MNKATQKMTAEEVQGMMHFRKRAYVVQNKKGKGSYKRHDKHRKELE